MAFATALKIAVVGGGWAGMAAAVQAARQGHAVTVFEAARQLGGRARALALQRPDGIPLTLDNGQHILIGAYTDTLGLMESVGIDLQRALLALPLGLPFPDGQGLQTPAWAARWPAPLDALAAIARARGWTWRDRSLFLRQALAWRLGGFRCHDEATVAQVCTRLPARVMRDLIEPLCVSALNLAPAQASGQVFLNVMRDALFGRGHRGRPPAHLLLPRLDLSALMPLQASQWLGARGAQVLTGTRVTALRPDARPARWVLTAATPAGEGEVDFDRVIWATAATHAAQAMSRAAGHADKGLAPRLQDWARTVAALDHTAIATVYAWAPGARLASPLLALRTGPAGPACSAQFVFDRAQLHPADPAMAGVLAFVVSASPDARDALEQGVLAQAAAQLGLPGLRPIRTVIERRATFACTPGLQRPAAVIAPGLLAAGDYIDGPYPATIEGAVRSGQHAVRALSGPVPGDPPARS